MSPDEVAQLVLDSVRAERFYIPTKPSFHAQIRERATAMDLLQLPPAARRSTDQRHAASSSYSGVLDRVIQRPAPT